MCSKFEITFEQSLIKPQQISTLNRVPLFRRGSVLSQLSIDFLCSPSLLVIGGHWLYQLIRARWWPGKKDIGPICSTILINLLLSMMKKLILPEEFKYKPEAFSYGPRESTSLIFFLTTFNSVFYPILLPHKSRHDKGKIYPETLLRHVSCK